MFREDFSDGSEWLVLRPTGGPRAGVRVLSSRIGAQVRSRLPPSF